MRTRDNSPFELSELEYLTTTTHQYLEPGVAVYRRLFLYNSETGSWVAYWLSQSTQTLFWDDATGSFFSY